MGGCWMDVGTVGAEECTGLQVRGWSWCSLAPVYWFYWELTASLCCQMVFEELT